MIVPDIGKTVINNANLTLVLVEVTFRKSQTTTTTKTAKKLWQLLEKEMNQLVFMWLKDMDPNFKHDSQGFFFLSDHNCYEADREFHAYLWQLGELT